MDTMIDFAFWLGDIAMWVFFWWCVIKAVEVLLVINVPKLVSNTCGAVEPANL